MSQDLYECQLRTPRELYIQKFKKVPCYTGMILDVMSTSLGC